MLKIKSYGNGAVHFTAIERQDVSIAFGVALRAARLNAGISQEELAGRAGVDRIYPSLLERALRTPTLAVIINLARALEIDPAELVRASVENIGKGLDRPRRTRSRREVDIWPRW